MNKIIITLITILLLVGNISLAQTSYIETSVSNDSIDCLKGISVYKEFQKLKFTDNAILQWKKTYNDCPGFKKIIYQDGVKFLRYLIKKEKIKEQKELLVDSLMHIYDARINYFGEQDYLKGRKGFDLYRYSKKRTEEANKLLEESVKSLKEKSGLQVLVSLIKTTEILYKQEKLGEIEFSKTYFLCINIIDKKLKIEQNAKKQKQIKKAKDIIEQIYSKNYQGDCNSVEKALSEQFNADSNNVELILKIQKKLSVLNCVHTDLYLKTALKLNQIKPNAANTYILAGLMIKNKQYNKSIEYLNQAISLEKNDSIKAQYYFDLAVIKYSKYKEYEQARNYAYKSIKLKANWGKPYLLIGDIYVEYSKLYGKTEFEHNTIIWLAVDMYKKAKDADNEIIDIANEKIKYYEAYFPTKDDVFFNGLIEGQNYIFNDWINRTTKIRVRS